MSGELQAQFVTGSTVYGVLVDASGGIWNGSAFDSTPTSGEWTTYAITMAEGSGSGCYKGDMPAASAGVYRYRVHKRVGGSAAATDPAVWTDDGFWSGTAWVNLTGDSFARIGAAGAGLTAVVAASVTGSVGSVAANGITAASIAADAIGASELAADAVAEIQSGLATSAAQTTLQTDLTTLTGRLTALRAGYLDNLSAGAVALASALATLQADATTLLSRITGAVSLATATTAAAIRSALGLASANLDTQIAAIPTSGVVADAVLDELLSGHTISGSAGAALSLAGSAADPMINDPADYTSGQLGYLIGRLAGGRITVRGTTTPTGDMDEIVGGADYSASDGYSFDWTDADSELAWPDLPGATITWVGRSPDGQVTTLAMTVVTPTGDKVVRLAMTAAQTAALVAVRTGIWTFTVWATLASGRVRPLAKGTVPVVELVGP